MGDVESDSQHYIDMGHGSSVRRVLAERPKIHMPSTPPSIAGILDPRPLFDPIGL